MKLKQGEYFSEIIYTKCHSFDKNIPLPSLLDVLLSSIYLGRSGPESETREVTKINNKIQVKELIIMEAKKKIGIGVVIILIAAIILHKPIALATMYLVDIIGNMTGANVSYIIDLLNNLYYL